MTRRRFITLFLVAVVSACASLVAGAYVRQILFADVSGPDALVGLLLFSPLVIGGALVLAWLAVLALGDSPSVLPQKAHAIGLLAGLALPIAFPAGGFVVLGASFVALFMLLVKWPGSPSAV